MKNLQNDGLWLGKFIIIFLPLCYIVKWIYHRLYKLLLEAIDFSALVFCIVFKISNTQKSGVNGMDITPFHRRNTKENWIKIEYW